MIDFDKAIEVATSSAKSLVKNAKNIELEGAMLSDDNAMYEICLSYDMQGESPFLTNSDNLSQLARLMRYRREYKVFLIDSQSAQFRGFRNQKDT